MRFLHLCAGLTMVSRSQMQHTICLYKRTVCRRMIATNVLLSVLLMSLICPIIDHWYFKASQLCLFPSYFLFSFHCLPGLQIGSRTSTKMRDPCPGTLLRDRSRENTDHSSCGNPRTRLSVSCGFEAESTSLWWIMPFGSSKDQ